MYLPFFVTLATLQPNPLNSRIFSVFLLLLTSLNLIGKDARAQFSLKDSTIRTPLIGVSYAFQFPAGDLKQRFGTNSSLGLHFFNKSSKNWIWGLDFTFTHAAQSQVLESQNLFDSIESRSGHVIDGNGEYASLLFYERGFTTTAKAGKIFPLWGQNQNSGICLLSGLGYMQHKIRIEDKYNRTPQLTKDYRKGYDRLSSGWMLSQFVGYMFLGSNRLLNFYAGFELMAGFTKNRRSYNFDTMEKETRQRIDIYYGPRIGFILPLYKRLPRDFYYN